MADITARASNITSSKVSMVCYTGTKVKMEQEATVSWIVEDMKDKMIKFQPGVYIKSTTFSIKDSKWHCKLWPNGKNIEKKGNISVGIYSEKDEQIITNLELSVGKSDHGWFKNKCKIFEFSQEGHGYVLNTFLPHELVLQNEKLLISCGRMEFMIKVSLVKEGATSPGNSLLEETSQLNRLRKLSDNFSDILWDESTSDFRIICEDDKFPVHRNVLKARSSFFKGLFANNFVESKTGDIVIEDIDSDTVKILVVTRTWCYTLHRERLKLLGRWNSLLEHLESKATQLIKASDKYDFPLLKKSCEDELVSTMDVASVVDLFVLAEDHNASELRVAAKKMILENKADIVKQDGWDTKLGTLVIELFKDI